MGSARKKFGTDADREVRGEKFDYGDFWFQCARAGGANKKFLSAWTERTRPLERKIKNGALSEEEGGRVLAEIWADTVVLGWGGVTMGDLDKGLTGPKAEEPAPFSRANAVKLFLELPALFADLREATTAIDPFRTQLLQEEAKNS